MLVRVAEPGRPAFQLRKGELGLSVFDLDAVVPPLTAAEVLASFRPGSVGEIRTKDEIQLKGMIIASIPGAVTLPDRLRQAHAEIRPGPGMSRIQFKKALKELE